MIKEFYDNEDSMDTRSQFVKKIYYSSEEADSSSIPDTDDSANPQYENFRNVVELNDLVSDEDFDTTKYLYYLTIESLSNSSV